MTIPKTIAEKLKAMKRREGRAKRRMERASAFESGQLANLVKLDQKLVLMGK